VAGVLGAAGAAGVACALNETALASADTTNIPWMKFFILPRSLFKCQKAQ
jgi:hypothetical protein